MEAKVVTMVEMELVVVDMELEVEEEDWVVDILKNLGSIPCEFG
jgi:hypothetical protein